MKNNVKVQDETQSLQSCVSVSVREFRIGNLVNYNGNHNEIGIVSEILKNDLTNVSPYKIGINHRVDIRYDIDKLKPIQLTEDWLLSFGFKNHENYFWYKKENVFSNMLSVGIQNKDGVITIIENIRYLHQLQNLYYIFTGSEL